MKGARHSAAALVPALLVALGACTPWTTRPIGWQEGGAASSAQSPTAYADSIWAAKLVPAILGSAVDARTLLDALAASPAEARARYGRQQAGGATFFIVKGRGQVTATDTRSGNGLALVDVAPYDGRPDVSIQIGPVLRGTALRDAPGLVHFTDFVNQLQFAEVANALNERVRETVLAPLGAVALKGREVSFAGALEADGPGGPPLAGLVPIQLTVEESR
jgi:predicted lipoprotein